MAYSIYRIRNKVNGKSYVGRTGNLERRLDQHVRELNNGTHHNSALLKDWQAGSPDDFVFETVEVIETIDEAIETEQRLIDEGIGKSLYNIGQSKFGDALTHNPNRDRIVENIRAGVNRSYSEMTPEEKREKFASHPNGMLGRTHSPEARAKLSSQMKGNQYALGSVRSAKQREALSESASLRTGEKNPFFGKKHSAETRAVMSEKKKGNVPPNIRAVVIEGNTFKSIADASRALGILGSTLHYRVNSASVKWSEYTYKEA